MKNLFAYGTLMCSNIMEDVSGVWFEGQSAVLHDYTRRCVKSEHYPGLTMEKNGSVDGIIYRNIPEVAWRRLDRFEGEMYRRCPVMVKLDDGTHLEAETYVVKSGFLQHLDAGEWDFDRFLKRGKDDFQQRYRGYKNL